MSRIATLTAVLTMLVAPAAMATDLRSPDTRDLSRSAITKIVDLRSPDARDVFTAPAASPAPHDGAAVSVWGVMALVAAGLAGCTGLTVMIRRHGHVGRTLGA